MVAILKGYKVALALPGDLFRVATGQRSISG